MTKPKHPPPEPLSDSDLHDIRERMAEWGVRGLAEWIGCTEHMIRKHAAAMGMLTPPASALKARRAREQIGVTKVCMTCNKVKLLREFHVQSSGYQEAPLEMP